MLGYLASLWGITGITLLLGSAIYRLSPIAWQTFDYPLLGYHWLALVLWVLFMAFAEGYRGFQKAWSPRVAARVHYLAGHVSLPRLLLAPLFCMGFFGTTRRRKRVTYCLTLGIIVLIWQVQYLATPWRGIVDSGVLVGLAWGLVSLWVFTWQAFCSDGFKHSPEVV